MHPISSASLYHASAIACNLIRCALALPADLVPTAGAPIPSEAPPPLETPVRWYPAKMGGKDDVVGEEPRAPAVKIDAYSRWQGTARRLGDTRSQRAGEDYPTVQKRSGRSRFAAVAATETRKV